MKKLTLTSLLLCVVIIILATAPRSQSAAAKQWDRYHSEAWPLSFDYLPTWQVVEQSIPLEEDIEIVLTNAAGDEQIFITRESNPKALTPRQWFQQNLKFPADIPSIWNLPGKQ